MASVCPNCPGSKIEYDSAQGSSYCTQCGAVLEENTITNEISFIEGGDGSSRMIGQFVAADRSGLRTLNMRNKRLNTSQSREETVQNAKRKIQEVAYALKGLNEYHINRATQCYKLALMNDFTQGRKATHVIAACLYVVCRQEKTIHMLIDFSDVLHTNVYSLGNTFLKLIRALNLRLPLIDPSLYLSRFATKLELGDKTHQVTTDALRLVQRMKRDWIVFGRRPSGICGACLLIACRMHGFKRTQGEVVRVVKICDMTLRKRLNEFSQTPSAELSVDQFRMTDLTEEANPPSFAHARRVNKVLRPVTENDEQENEIEHQMNETLNNQDLLAPKPPVLPAKWVDVQVDPDIAKWDDIDDSELDEMFLGDSEIEAKKNIWENLNKDWIELQERKRQRQEELEAEAEQAPQPKEKRVRKAPSIKATRKASIKEAHRIIEDDLSQSSTSKKINYEALGLIE